MTTDKRQRPCSADGRPMPFFCFHGQGHNDSFCLRLSTKGISSNLLCVIYWLKDHHIFGMVWSSECQDSSFIHTLNLTQTVTCVCICSIQQRLVSEISLLIETFRLEFRFSRTWKRAQVEVLMQALCVYSGTDRNFFFCSMVYIPILTVFPPG